jgi:hypothetical protein
VASLALAGGVCLTGASRAAAQTISYVQGNYAVPQIPQATVTVSYTAAQHAGDLNVVVIGWNDVVSHVVSVADTRGNLYVLAVGPTVQPGIHTQAMYYAANIAAADAGANTVTVTFDRAADFPDLRIAEYSGLAATGPVDAATGASGTGAASDSGPVLTSNASDLLVAANYVQTTTIQGGASFTTRLITSPNGSVLQDRIVAAAGSYSASASLSGTGGWVMQLVAFRAAVGLPAPAITGVSPSSGGVGTVVTITGSNFGTTQGASTLAFNGVAASPTSWSATSIVAPVPPGATAGNIVVTVAGQASNGAPFTVATSEPVTIAFVQSNYSTPQTPQATVTVPYTQAQTAGNLNVVIVGWSDTTAQVQSVTDTQGNAYVTAVGPTVQTGVATQSIYYASNIAGAAANANAVTVTFSTAARFPDVRAAEYAGLDRINPVDGTAAAQGIGGPSSSGTLTTTHAPDLLVAANLVQGLTTAPGSGFTARVITSPDGDLLEDRIVAAAGSYIGTAEITGDAWIMQTVAFRGISGGTSTAPTITGISPGSGAAGTAVAIVGANFGATRGSSTVMFNGTPASPSSWSATAITVPVPAGATSGNVVVTVSGQASNGVAFTITQPVPRITAINPAQGPVWTTVSVSGANFGAAQGASTITFNGRPASPISWSATTIVVPVPPGAATGPVVVTAAGQASNGVTFTVGSPVPTITDVSPRSGAAGTLVTISGVNFLPNQGNSTIAFNGTPAVPNSWSATSIVVPVPASATSGAIVITVGGDSSNGVAFTVVSATATAYPLKVSSNGRYLVDQNNVPFLLVGDTGHAISGNLSEAEIAFYFASRQSYGFNSVVIYAPCAGYVRCNSDGSTFDGIRPFTGGEHPLTYDLSTPNEVYFSRVDRLIASAAEHGLVVLLDPIETGDFLQTLRANGPARAFDYGMYVGSRYRNFGNVIWLHGEDFQTWETENYLVAAVMAGIATADPNHLQTIQLNYQRSYSRQAIAALAPYLTLDHVYTYYDTYDYMLAAYNSSPTMPTLLGEANYEEENNTGALPRPAGPKVLRQQIYWALLSGGSGHLWGNGPVNHAHPDWANHLDTPAVGQVAHSTSLFTRYPWWMLVPDQSHAIVTAGYGSYTGDSAYLTDSNYVTTAWIEDGSLAMAYCPTSATLTVDLTRFARPIVARWYDPASGTFLPIAGSPFANSGAGQFVTPATNDDGDADWVLVLDAGPSTLDTQPPTAPAALTATASGTQIGLEWSASSDNVGVSSYLIERCQGNGCSTFTQVGSSPSTTYADFGVSPATSYSYRVRAADAFGTLSGYSNTATTSTPPGAVAIAFRQVSYATPQTPQTSVMVPFSASVTAGGLIVVVVGWSDSVAAVQSVTDTAGNTYIRAVGPTVQAGVATQSIYYAANIAAVNAGQNAVTVTFTAAARYPDIRIAEYGGIDPVNPVDAVASASGSGTLSSSGPLVTTNANDLLVAANLVQSLTSGPGSGFTSRVLTSPDGDILQDRVVASTDTYTATAPVSPGAEWLMQMVAFRAAGSLSPALP